MFVDEIWDFKSLNMGRELEIAGEFIYDSAKKTMALTGLNNQYEINAILYTGSVGIERLQKIYLCLLHQNPADRNSMPKCLMHHSHTQLEKEIEKFTEEQLPYNSRSLLGIFEKYYNKFRYGNYIPGNNADEIRTLFISFLKKQNGQFNFDEPYVLSQFEDFKRFFINELGKLANHYFKLVETKAREINVYTYEISSSSNAARVFWSSSKQSLYQQMILEQEAIKELLLYLYKGRSETGVFKILNDMESLEFDDSLINDYLSDLCNGQVNDSLIDYVEEIHEEIQDEKERKEREELLSLIGNQSVLFDFDVDNYEDE